MDLTKAHLATSGRHGEDFIEFVPLNHYDRIQAREAMRVHKKKLEEINRVDDARALEAALNELAKEID